MPRHPIDLKLSGTAAQDGTLTLRTHAFKAGGLLCIQRVSVRCAENKTLVADVSLERQNDKLFLETLYTSEDDQVVTMTGQTYAPSDYGVCLDIKSANDADLVEAFIFGYWTSFPE